ncbi:MULTISPECIES: hypothetical protein [unclassified Leptolyngbya]
MLQQQENSHSGEFSCMAFRAIVTLSLLGLLIVAAIYYGAINP